MLSTFWQVWITVIVVGSIIGCGLLIQFASRGMAKEDTNESTGHEYDGIIEYDNPMPRWWVFMFWGTIIFAFLYMGAYGLGNFQGFLKLDVDGEKVSWSSANQWKNEVQKFDERIAPLYEEYSAIPVEELVNNTEALKSGQRLYKSNCSVCHGTNAKGALGFPDLTDNDWLWGGTPEQIKHTIANGRQGVMPSHEAILGGEQGIQNMVHYVRSLSGLKHETEPAAQAESTFKTVCAACHGADAKGNIYLGAPDLTDEVWLYGGSSKQIEFTLRHGRHGTMPAHKDILGSHADAKVHLLTAYVYSLSQGNE